MSEGSHLRFDDKGLITVVAQDHLTGEIRMVAHANSEAVAATLATGQATFWSRSRAALWVKGESSGHSLSVQQVLVDCDQDCLIYSVEPAGPSCHTGQVTCFFRQWSGEGPRTEAVEPQLLIDRLEQQLEARKSSTGKSSYTKSLYDGGAAAIGAKLREEAGELADAIAGESDERVLNEAADVVYHLLVGLRSRGLPFRGVLAVLGKRFGKGGHDEKASRKK